ncbi:MAG: primosomal protein N' [Deltaproteobacteria bacterium]|nr:primosomal protein N' [Deltaproteobacteria bacterium]
MNNEDLPTQYVRVAVLIPGFSKALTYALPERLFGKAEIGMRVRVQVQRREVVGVLLGEDDDPPEKTRQLQALLDDKPVVDQAQISLALFVARYYFSDLSEAMRLILPPDTAREVVRILHLTDRGRQALVFGKSLGLKAAEEKLIAAFAEGQRIAFHILRKKFRSAAIDRMLEGGYLEKVEQHDVKKHRIDEVLLPVNEGEELPQRAHALAAFDAWVRAETKSSRGPPRMSQAKVAFSDARGKAKRLVEIGRLKLESEGKLIRIRAALRSDPRPIPTAEQSAAIATSWDAYKTHINDDKTGNPTTNVGDLLFLLEGVTGSGKTEVYLTLLERMLEIGKGSLLIVPEIALTPQLVSRVNARVNEEIAVLHSGMSKAERRDALFGLREGRIKVAVGARSALFAPIQNLGLIVVDEEHDSSFKQSESPRYQGRDVALWRARNEGALCILGSATPSLETRHNVQEGKLGHLRLEMRIGGGGELPQIEIIDLKKRKVHRNVRDADKAQTEGDTERVLSAPLQLAIKETLDDKKQAMLFLNRRGYAASFLCGSCGTIAHCPSCSVPLTFHKGKGAALCHQCGHQRRALDTCTECGRDGLLRLGLGTERVEAEIRALFPSARVARLDRDTVSNTKDLERILQDMQRGEIEVLIGTQMIAKGHDFPNVTLVGVVLADVALSTPDFRASERAFALLTQVAGRAGRGEKRGRVLVQTYNPDHPALHFAFRHDVEGFLREELAERELLRYPPFWRAALLRVEGEDGTYVQSCANRVGQLLRNFARDHLPAGSWDVLGPAPAPIEKLKNKMRMQVFIRTGHPRSRAQLLEILQDDEALKSALRKTKCRLILDVDPAHML